MAFPRNINGFNLAEALEFWFRNSGDTVDAVELAASVRRRLSRPGIILSQAASYWVSGDLIQLEHLTLKSEGRGKYSRPYLVFRSILIAI